MMRTVLDATEEDYELIKLKDIDISPCKNCMGCHDTFECAVKDGMQQIYQKLIDADVIVFGSPTFFDNVSGRMKTFMDRCLPFYFSGELEGKKVVVLSGGGFSKLIELDDKGECITCKEGDLCNRSVSRCIDSIKYFVNHMGMDLVAELGTIHGDPAAKKEELIKIGKGLVR